MEQLHQPRIFISYKRADKERVFVIKDSIEQATGERCWIDLDGIESDAQFVEVIMNAIDDCEVFLFMRSAEHNKITNHRTDWTIREVNYALGERKRIVFVALDNSPLPRWFKFMFPNQQEIDATDNARLKGLCADLQSWLGLQRRQDDKQKHNAQNLHNGHEYVDLGLSVKWATCNVGANTPEEYGDYFAWGETDPKQSFTNDNYLYKGNPVTLPLSADAAHVNWGENWRMPTKQEQEELYNNCAWEWTNVNAVKGYKVIGKNGNYIFLPAGGYMSDNIICDGGTSGYYWSGMLSNSNSNNSSCLYFLDSYVNRYYNARYFGQTIRPVHQ